MVVNTEPSVAELALTLLHRARDRIANPERWTTEHYARNLLSEAVPLHSENACSWCSMGALARELFELRVEQAGSLVEGTELFLLEPGDVPDEACWYARTALNRAARFLASYHHGWRAGSLEIFNDDAGHVGVMAMFDRAIRQLEGEIRNG